MRSMWILLVLWLLTTPALASDGVLEINQACATTGCFPGDTAQFPVTITAQAGRSFRLTSDLILPNENVSAIRVGVSGVTIDLNGFSIRGVTVCAGDPPLTPVNCSPGGSGSGIEPDPGAPALPHRVAVRNGSILGMGSYGVRLGERAQLRDLRISGAAAGTISVDRSSIIESTSVDLSATDGLFAGPSTVVRNVTAETNAGAGIFVGNGSTISDSTSRGNSGTGFGLSSFSTIRHSTGAANSGSGIVALEACTLTGNTLQGNAGGGAFAGAGSNVIGNTARGNTGLGLNLQNPTGYSTNVVTENTTAGQVLGGLNRGGNYCANTAATTNVCP